MDILKGFNHAIDYIENNLCEKVNVEKVAMLACCSVDGFKRIFSFLTGMTITEYIRKRKLSACITDLQNGNKVIDIALKYGYDSVDAFSRAFRKQHHILPSEISKESSFNIYPPISFHILIKGAKKMDFKIIEFTQTEVFGVAKQFDGKDYKTREELRHIMWSEECDDVPGQISEGRWDQPINHFNDGVWYGIWNNGKYAITREKTDTNNNSLEKFIIPSGTYATFKTQRGGLAWEELPKLFDLIFESWLQSSEYIQASDLIIEVYHLWTDKVVRNKNRYYEVWIPVAKK